MWWAKFLLWIVTPCWNSQSKFTYYQIHLSTETQDPVHHQTTIPNKQRIIFIFQFLPCPWPWFLWLFTAHLVEDPPTLPEKKLGEIFEKSDGTWYTSSSGQIWSYWFPGFRYSVGWTCQVVGPALLYNS